MEWFTLVKQAIKYIEEHLLDEDCAEAVLRQTYMSPMLFQKGFQILTGYSLSAYIRNRRLYQSAQELLRTDRKVIDVALDYGFETPESFTKAFTRFHGSSPVAVRQGAAVRPFLPLRLSISVQGGDQIDCRVLRKSGFVVEGYIREFESETAQDMIPLFWDEVASDMDFEGEFGICIDDIDESRFHYMIAKASDRGGQEDNGNLGKNLYASYVNRGPLVQESYVNCKNISQCCYVNYELPAQEWAVFECFGENPAAIQELDMRIWKEWLPGNTEYALDGKANVEWYGDGRSEIWIPVRSL